MATKPNASVVKKASPQIPVWLLGMGGSMSLGGFLLVCLCLLMRKSGGGNGRMPNVLGVTIRPPPKPSSLPATLLSGILVSAAVCFVICIGSVILTRQQRMSDQALAELHGKMYDVMRRVTAAEQARMKRYQEAAKLEREALKWILNPFVMPLYQRIPRFVLLGRVLGEYASLEEAKVACNNTKNATHIQVSVETGKAVIKTILELPEKFGTTKDTAATLKARCGEGFHKYMDTYIHPRFFLLNTANQISSRDWVDLTIADLLATQATQERLKGQLNEQCMLGNSGTCQWESVWKSTFFNVILQVVFAIIDAVVTVLTAGMATWAIVLVQVAVIGVDLGVTLGVPAGLTIQQQKEAKALEDRMKLLKNGGALSNAYLGQKDSYWGLFSRMTLDECSIADASKKYAFYTTQENADGKSERELAAHQWAMWDKLKVYELLPVDFWNCDEITGLLDVHGRFKTNQTPGKNTYIMYKNNKNACVDADATFVRREFT
jgi:hypothetical protein